jgi:hypothetical protein
MKGSTADAEIRFSRSGVAEPPADARHFREPADCVDQPHAPRLALNSCPTAVRRRRGDPAARGSPSMEGLFSLPVEFGTLVKGAT